MVDRFLAELYASEEHSAISGHDGSTESKTGGWLDNLVFFTVQDALQVLPGEETD